MNAWCMFCCVFLMSGCSLLISCYLCSWAQPIFVWARFSFGAISSTSSFPDAMPKLVTVRVEWSSRDTLPTLQTVLETLGLHDFATGDDAIFMPLRLPHWGSATMPTVDILTDFLTAYDTPLVDDSKYVFITHPMVFQQAVDKVPAHLWLSPHANDGFTGHPYTTEVSVQFYSAPLMTILYRLSTVTQQFHDCQNQLSDLKETVNRLVETVCAQNPATASLFGLVLSPGPPRTNRP